MTRVCAIVLAVVLAGCPTSSEDAGAPTADADGENGGGASAAECTVDSECTAAGESCCVCPSFAVPVSSGWDDSCEDVSCEPPACSTEAACDQGACVLRCTEVSCAGDVECPAGFARDQAGCLSCACAVEADPAAAQCQVDGDCVQVAADCCGCAQGGSDTAVPAGEADDFARGLGCDTSPSCPGIDVCDPAAIPRCIAGSCALSAGSGGEDGTDGGLGGEPALCGTPQLPACPAGQQCVLNDPDSPQATEMGVGVCR